MKYIFFAIGFLIIATPTFAAQNMTANSTTYNISGTINFSALTNTSEIPQQTGTVAYCYDCKQTNPCQGGGTGAFGLYTGNAWQCGFGYGATQGVNLYPGNPGQVAGYDSTGVALIPLNNVNATLNAQVNPTLYGARADLIYSGDNIHLQDGVCDGSTRFAAPSGAFPNTIVGDTVIIDTSTGVLQTTVAAWLGSSALTLKDPCAPGTALNWRIGFDNQPAFQAAANAAAAIGNYGSYAGTVYIPAGHYLTRSTVTMDRTHCNVSINGDPTGTIIMPWFQNSYGFAWSDQTNQPPAQCYGGLHDILFHNIGNAPYNMDLVYVSNEQGISIDHVRCSLFDSPGDSCILLDPGNSPLGQFNTWTETVQMTNIVNWYTTTMLTLDGKNQTSFSLNNDTLTNSHCDPTGSGSWAGSCIHLTRWGAGGALLNSHFEFNADLNGAGLSAISTDHRADDWHTTDASIDIRVQALSSGTFCFSAPANTGWWGITGQAFCASSAMEANGNPVIFNTRSIGSANGDMAYNSPISFYTGPAPYNGCGTNPQFSPGSTAAAGEIIAGSGATSCAVEFAQYLGPSDVHCSVTADGQPTFLFTNSSKGRNVNIFNCRTLVSGTNCMSSAVFSYACTGW